MTSQDQPQYPTRNMNRNAGEPIKLTPEDALRAFAAMMNTLDVSRLEPLLADDFHYASQWVFAEIESKAQYLAYVTGKIETIKRSDSKVWAELGEIQESPFILSQGYGDPCVFMAQGDKNKVISIVFASLKDNKISRIDMCMPELYRGRRLGVYPI